MRSNAGGSSRCILHSRSHITTEPRCPMSVKNKSCVPPDAFWKLNQEFAELLWRRQDGGTVSTRLAEPISDLFNVPLQDAKAVLHGAVAVGAGVAVAKSIHPLVAVGLGLAIFTFLERDRCGA